MIMFGLRREYGTSGFHDPWQTWRNDCAVLITYVCVGALIVAAGAAFTAALAGGRPVVVAMWTLAGLVAGVLIGAGAASATTATAVFTFVQISVTHGTPVRLIAFLEDARRRHLIRVTGDAYQFRHAKLQDRLTAERARTDALTG
jgi:hypothetical protein